LAKEHISLNSVTNDGRAGVKLAFYLLPCFRTREKLQVHQTRTHESEKTTPIGFGIIC